ncbi:MAG: uroporphyrinogen-III synthase, partial [Actinomycetota bacterium]
MAPDPHGPPPPRVIVTRSEADNRSLIDALNRTGITVIPFPLVAVIEPSDGGDALRAAVERLADYRHVALTSVNAVAAVAEAIDGRDWPAGTEVAAVGPVTAAAAAAQGWPVGIVPVEATAAALVAGFPPAPSLVGPARPSPGPPGSAADPVRVLAPLSSLAADTVVDGL